MKNEQEFEENDVLNWLEQNGWSIKPEENLSSEYYRRSDQVIFWEVLERKVRELNDLTTTEYEQYVEPQVEQAFSIGSSLLSSNMDAVQMLRSGGTFTDGDESKCFDLIDFDNIENNEFVAINQFEFEDSDPHRRRRPDIVLFVNGIPLCVLELKSVGSQNTTVDAIRQIQNTYEEEIPELFVPNVYNIVLNQNRIRYGAIGCDEEHYHYWKSDASDIHTDVRSHLWDLTERSTILDILRDFTFYDESGVEPTKIIPRHQQYYATKELVSDVRNSEAGGELGKQLVVHVQGSGKSYAMMYAAHILAKYDGYPVFIVVDETELVKQFGADLRNIAEISETVVRSDEGSMSGSEQLEQVVEQGEGGVVLTILHLFNELDRDVSLGKNAVVLADEAHRFLEDVLGSRMESVLEPFHYYGFTGTPVSETYEMFADEDNLYLHKYSMADGVEEDAILPVKLTSVGDKLAWAVNEGEIDRQFEESDIPEETKRDYLSSVLGTEELAGLDSRVETIADDIEQHFRTEVRSGGLPFKGMVVTKGKSNAAKYGRALKERFSDEDVAVIYSSSNSDTPDVQEFHKTEQEQNEVITAFKNPDDDPKLLVVCDKLRTGFDAPVLRTIYLDRQFSGGHTLLQTIARTNRPIKTEDVNKEYGEIIDYQGSTEEFEELVEYDKSEIDTFVSEDKEKFKKQFERQLENLRPSFDGDDIEEWIDQLDSTEVQKEYIQEFQNLRSLYKNIRPDSFLDQYVEEYKKFKDVYDTVQTFRKASRQRLKERVVDIVQPNVEVAEKDEYEEVKKMVEGIDEVDTVKVTKRKKTLDSIINHNARFDPRYEELSERVEDIIENWNQDLITNGEAIDRLDDVMEKTEQIQEDFEGTELDERVYAVKQLLATEADIEDTESVAEAVVSQFDEYSELKRDWLRKHRKVDRLNRDLAFTLRDYSKELSQDDDFIHELSKKLVELSE